MNWRLALGIAVTGGEVLGYAAGIVTPSPGRAFTVNRRDGRCDASGYRPGWPSWR